MVVAVGVLASLAIALVTIDARRIRRRLHATVDDLAATNDRAPTCSTACPTPSSGSTTTVA